MGRRRPRYGHSRQHGRRGKGLAEGAVGPKIVPTWRRQGGDGIDIARGGGRVEGGGAGQGSGGAGGERRRRGERSARAGLACGAALAIDRLVGELPRKRGVRWQARKGTISN